MNNIISTNEFIIFRVTVNNVEHSACYWGKVGFTLTRQSNKLYKHLFQHDVEFSNVGIHFERNKPKNVPSYSSQKKALCAIIYSINQSK